MLMGMVDVVIVFWVWYMKFDLVVLGWVDWDWFIFFVGYGLMLIYLLLYLIGFEDVIMDEFCNFCQMGLLIVGYFEYGYMLGVEVMIGLLGQGIFMVVGMVLVECMFNVEYGDDLVDYWIWVIVFDGDFQEGISYEVIFIVGYFKLNCLCVLWDDNEILIDGVISVLELIDVFKWFEVVGWMMVCVDGYDMDVIDQVLFEVC